MSSGTHYIWRKIYIGGLGSNGSWRCNYMIGELRSFTGSREEVIEQYQKILNHDDDVDIRFMDGDSWPVDSILWDWRGEFLDQNHIEEGKEELNFSEWVKYKPKRKAHKMEEIAEMVNEDEMPMSSYTIIHGEAKLSAAQKKLLVEWAMAAHDSLKAAIPVVVEKP